MADNVTLPAQGTGSSTPIVASDELTYSGDTAKVQVIRQVHVSGSEGSKTLTEVAVIDDAAVTPGTHGVVLQGRQAVAMGANPDALDADDGGFGIQTRHRQQFVIGGHPNAKTATYNTTASQTDDTLMAAIAGGTKYAVTALAVTLDEACTVGVAVRIGFGTANVPALGSSGADAVDDILLYHPGMVPGGGMTRGDGSGILGVGGDGAELRITCEAPTGGTLGVMITYFTLPS